MPTSTPPRLEDFYPPAYQRLVGALVVMGVPPHAATDVAQEAFVRLIPRWQRIRDYDRPESWLRTVAWRIWLNDRRHAWRISDAEVPEGAIPADDPTAHDDLTAALAGLPEGQREVVALHYLTDLPVARVAAELGIAEGTVKSRLSRARATLAQALSPEEVTDE